MALFYVSAYCISARVSLIYLVTEKLRTADGAAFDSHAGEHNAQCYSDTRVEILDQIKEWACDPYSKCIYWLNGIAGTGKSTISRTIAQRFKDQGLLGASFFFKRAERDRDSGRLFFATIAYQLLSRVESLEPGIRDAIDADPDLTGKVMKEQFEKLIFQPLDSVRNDLENPANIVIVVDALDECYRDEDIKMIIYLLSRIKDLNSVRMKIFITSRPELPIRLGFDEIKGEYTDVALHQIPEPVIERDISKFLRYKLMRIRNEYNSQNFADLQLPSDWPSEHVIQILVHMAVPLFIFAATVCRFIEDSAWSNPASQLKKVLDYQTNARDSELNRLDATYLPILDQLIVGRTGLQRRSLVEQFRDVAGPIILLAEPLSMSSLAILLNIPTGAVAGRLRSLHSVLDVPSKTDSPIRMFHLSFRDFLIDPAKRTTNEFWVDETKCHERLAKRCLDLLSSGYLKRDICNQKNPGKARIEVDPQTIDTCLPAPVRYACLYWVYHLTESKEIIQDRDYIYCFLEHHFLHWLEALSLLGKISESISMIDNLLAIVDVSHLVISGAAIC
jgi:hypothetical protein